MASLSPSPPPPPPTPSLSSEKDPDSSSPSPPPTPSTTTPRPTISPTAMEIFTAALYPLTLFAGSLFSFLSPSAASSTSYFSKKHNLFNLLFVKQGWFWTTIAFLFYALRLRRSSKPRAVLRYALATLWWVFVTQWFFGPPIMDRTFTVTGGTCQAVASDPSVREKMGATTVAVTSAACKIAGGNWKGGHDLSGHTFLLTHASLFLWSEVAPGLMTGEWDVGTWGVVACLGMWWWMLLMTGVYFHTWREKLTGLVVSMIEWVVVYIWVSKTQPELRGVVGIPGV